MTHPEQQDELLLRYRQATAQDARRPADRVRDAVRAHAQAVVSPSKQEPPDVAPRRGAAANQARWTVPMLASVALIGLTGLLLLQFDRATPEEKELVMGQPVDSARPAPVVRQPTRQVPVATDSRADAVPPAPESEQRPAPSAGSGGNTSDARRRLPGPQPRQASVQSAPVAPMVAPVPGPVVASEAVPAAPAAKLADTSAVPAGAAMGARSNGAVVPAPAPSVRAAAGQDKSSAAAMGAPLNRAEVRSTRESPSALRDLARTGDVSQLAHLLALGFAPDAADDAGRTPLMLAVIHGHSEMVRQLLAAGANPALEDREHMTALAHARRLGRDAIARMIEARN